MASKSGRAGASTRDLAEKRRLIRLSFAFVGLILGWVFLKVLPHAQTVGFGLVMALFVAFKVAMSALENQVDKKIKEEKRAIRGAVGEGRIGGLLDGLDDEHVVLHDLVCPFGNIDHVVLSRHHGLFLIETKAHGGRVAVVDSRILVNGKPPEKDFITQTLRNTYWLRDQVKAVTGAEAWVNSLIVFTNAFVERSRPIKGITVTNKKFLLKAIERNGKPLPVEVWDARERLTQLLSPSAIPAPGLSAQC
jgi:hypothetical protein